MPDTIKINLHIEPAQQGTYFTVPFTIPPGIERLAVSYSYPRRPAHLHKLENASFTATPEMNIIDLGLIGPDGKQVGASGSDKLEFTVSEVEATPGYQPTPIRPGEWAILVGAYKVQPEGVDVVYEITLDPKRTRLLKGDLHAHTLASDGVHTLPELAYKALRNGLDFLAITDHNQMIAQAALPRIPGVTLIPGLEWTHFRGHANFLGVEQPYDEPFAANTPQEVRARFESAHARGALISINHPLDPDCGFHFDLAALPFDMIEVWNGPMREPNLRAVGFWHQMLTEGKKIPMCGGSDYHRDTPFIFLGGPTTCVYAQSNGPSDILSALRAGHAFVTFAPNGPTLHLSAAQAGMGDSVAWADVKEMTITASGLREGDVVRVATARSTEAVFKAPQNGELTLTYPISAPGFARVEILRAFLPGLPMLPAALSNPIYFDAP